MNWLNLALNIVMALQAVEKTVKGDGKTKQQKALEIIDSSILAAAYAGVDKGVLSLPEVVSAKKAAIDAVVAFENAVAAAKLSLHPSVVTNPAV